jgi:PncC family amidohydrolase
MAKKDLPEIRIARILRKKKKTLAVAESCTGGLVSSRITDIPGSSDYFLGGIVAYSNNVKISLLGVPGAVLKKHGAVSREAAIAMARGVKKALKTDVAAAVTGIAGPSGGSARKPVGLAYIAFVSGKNVRSLKVHFKGGRPAVKARFAQAVLEMIEESV